MVFSQDHSGSIMELNQLKLFFTHSFNRSALIESYSHQGAFDAALSKILKMTFSDTGL